uniref:Caspase activity and apoptosis inhibitor 1 n=1 Tax=Phallusia mammillata TaxID=59560 RepID=A0A6F9D8Q0_9ASCI|nr:caspase activity and apoptosis inhibitor 1 [Phallusia mammillata]
MTTTRRKNRVVRQKEESHKHHKSKKDGKADAKKSKQKSHKGTKRAADKNRKSKNVKEKRRRSRKKSEEDGGLTGDSDVEEDGLNLEKELQPLGFYVKDRKHLMDQVFEIVKGPKLGAMLPEILKNISPEELKQRCLGQLEVMSSKRINHVLAGEVMSSSSGTDSSDDDSSEAVPKVSSTKTNKEQPTVQANFVDSTTTSGCEVFSLLAEGSKPPAVQEGSISSAPKDTEDVDSEEGEVTSEEEITIVEEEELESSDVEIETVEVVEDEDYQEMVDEILEETMSSGKQEEEKEEKTQLELLELQLRERAIKSLMRAAGKLGDQ